MHFCLIPPTAVTLRGVAVNEAFAIEVTRANELRLFSVSPRNANQIASLPS
jgi:hypothetical protein